jgi:hypothetical protein
MAKSGGFKLLGAALIGLLFVVIGGWSWLYFSSKPPTKKPSIQASRGKTQSARGAAGKAVKSGRSRTSERSGSASPKFGSPGGYRSTGNTDGFTDEFNPAEEMEPGELMVVDPPRGFEEAARRLGFSILEQVSLSRLSMSAYRVGTPKGMSLDKARSMLQSRFPRLSMDANHRFDLPAERRRKSRRGAVRRRSGRAPTGAAPQVRRSKVTSLAQAAIGWRNLPASCGKGVRLGMIDSGVDLGHPALKGQKIETRSFHNPKRRRGPKEHGTAIATLLVGKPSAKGWGGLLPGAELKAANMFELNRTGKKVGNAMALIKGLDWMITKRVHVVNLSIAGSDNRIVRKALDQARKKGLVVVAAAGNWGRADRPAFPAAYGDVIAVTAVGAYKGIYKRANTGKYIDFAAPGVRMLTAVPGGGTRYQSGTSFATPFLSVLVALEIANGSAKNAGKLRANLARTSADLGRPGKDQTFGYGFVNKKPNCAA